jgi:DeoR/GlpR family transcriptional regulator of sugar metabolism
MFTEERLQKILEELNHNGKVLVKDLSEKFHVTNDCIRKDLKVLENEGKLRRAYGGAILSRDNPLKKEVSDRKLDNIKKKKIVAQKAQEVIKEGETIFLDTSSTNICLAELLVKSQKRLTVVSNMIDIVQILADSPYITAIATGGVLTRSVNAFIGAAAIDVIKNYSFDRAFLGTSGIDIVNCAVTTYGVEDGLTKRAVIQNSRHKYIVMEKDKFYFNDSYRFALFNEIDGIITDEQPDSMIMQILKRNEVTLY